MRRSGWRRRLAGTFGRAVFWPLENGFKPDTLRTIDPALLVRSRLRQPALLIGDQHWRLR
jgi:hypothetical protein